MSTSYCGHFWPIAQAPDDGWGWLWSSWWNEDWQGKPKYSEKTCPSTTLSTTNLTWSDSGQLESNHVVVVMNGLQAYHRFFFSRWLCLWHLWSVSPSSPVAQFSRCLLSSCSGCSLFKTARPEQFPDGVQTGPGVPPSVVESELVEQSIGGLLQFGRCKPLLLDAGS
jgi:hypothetical protein